MGVARRRNGHKARRRLVGAATALSIQTEARAKIAASAARLGLAASAAVQGASTCTRPGRSRGGKGRTTTRARAECHCYPDGWLLRAAGMPTLQASGQRGAPVGTQPEKAARSRSSAAPSQQAGPARPHAGHFVLPGAGRLANMCAAGPWPGRGPRRSEAVRPHNPTAPRGAPARPRSSGSARPCPARGVAESGRVPTAARQREDVRLAAGPRRLHRPPGCRWDGDSAAGAS